MPVKGIPNVVDFLKVRNMPVGEVAYLSVDDVYITNKVIFVHLEAIVLYNTEEENDLNYCCAQIKRTGPGLTQDDFLIDFSFCNDAVYELQSDFEYKNLLEF